MSEKSKVQALVEVNREIQLVQAEISQAVANLQTKLITLSEQDHALRIAVKEEMEARGLKKFEDENIAITYIAPTSRRTLDSSAIKLQEPEIYEKYTKISEVSSSVRITIK